MKKARWFDALDYLVVLQALLNTGSLWLFVGIWLFASAGGFHDSKTSNVITHF